MFLHKLSEIISITNYSPALIIIIFNLEKANKNTFLCIEKHFDPDRSLLIHANSCKPGTGGLNRHNPDFKELIVKNLFVHLDGKNAWSQYDAGKRALKYVLRQVIFISELLFLCVK